MGNPFAITSDELLKKQQGIGGTGSTDGTQNTQEAREAKGKEQLYGTNVLDQTNGGSMVTTDGVFENYDGFVRTAPVQQSVAGDSECDSATSDAQSAQDSAGEAESAANAAARTAQRDQATLENADKQARTRQTRTINKVDQNNAATQEKLSENDQLESEINEIESEIETLMAEDGQDYTAQTVTADDAPPQQPAAPQQGNNAQNGPTQGNVNQPTNGVGASGGQEFAMWSLPAQQAPAAPTSETGVAAQNNDNAQNGQSGQPVQQNQPTQQGQAKQRTMQQTPNSTAGNSLKAFGPTVAPEGKNADKINELMGESSLKQTIMESNSSTIASLRMSSNSLINSGLSFTQNVNSNAKAKAAANQDGLSVAQGAQIVGAATTTTGGVITGIAQVKMASPTIATQIAGANLLPWGIGTTAAGGATTTAASFATGQTTEAINQAGSTTTSSLQGLAQYKTARQNLA